MNQPRMTSRHARAASIVLLAGLLLCGAVGARQAPANAVSNGAMPADVSPPDALPTEPPRARAERADKIAAQDPVQSRALAEQVLGDALSDHGSRMLALFVLGRAELMAGRFSAAIVQFEQALALSPDPTQPKLRARLLTYLGATLDRSGLSVDAIAPEQQALAIYLEQRNWLDASAVLANLGNAYSSQGDLDAARAHYERALALKRDNGITRGVGSVLNNLADLRIEAGDAAGAAANLRDAIAASTAPEDIGALCLAHSNLAIALSQQGDFDGALTQIARAGAIAQTLKDSARQLSVRRSHALVLLAQARALPPGASSRALALRDAGTLVQPAIAQAAANGDPMRQLQLTDLLAEIRETQGDPAAALALMRDAKAQRDAIDARNQNDRRATASARFEYAKQSSELELLRQREAAGAEKLRNQGRTTTALMLAVLGMLGAAAAVARHLHARRKFERVLQARNGELGAALQEAQAQRQRSEAYAGSHRELLQLASEDLRAPLNQIRADAERVLVDQGDADQRGRRIASIARTAADLIWVTDQMLQSAHRVDPEHRNGTSSTPLHALLQDLLGEAGVRALRHQQELRLDDAGAHVAVAVDATRLRAALHELFELLLRASPAQSRFAVRIVEHPASDADAMVYIDDPANVAPDWRQMGGRGERNARLPQLGFAWVAQTLAQLGGEIGSTMRGAPPQRVITIRLPRALAPPGRTPD